MVPFCAPIPHHDILWGGTNTPFCIIFAHLLQEMKGLGGHLVYFCTLAALQSSFSQPGPPGYVNGVFITLRVTGCALLWPLHSVACMGGQSYLYILL
uniref:Uncharacterized protein n=1 Tax=Pyxicephalus adspersus TaxID=30357 RepID=A0AAV2ZJ37_PYXAD|nr:TPA: hypothetical protein GDO54_003084 [Pyxicephalus adspersus]